jgi:hypothetical protein
MTYKQAEQIFISRGKSRRWMVDLIYSIDSKQTRWENARRLKVPYYQINSICRDYGVKCKPDLKGFQKSR